jgi:hypothetical protein
LAIPGLGLVVAVAVFSGISHSEANRIGEACEELESVNRKNAASVSKLNSDLVTLGRYESKLTKEHEEFSNELRSVGGRLFRFGFLSHLRRLMLYRSRGYYYSEEESRLLDRLEFAVKKFVSAFARI